MLRRLKLETADLHAAAELHVRILDGDATAADYARYLRAMAGFHAPIEDAFSANLALKAIGFAPETRRKAHLARADLRAMSDSAPVPCAIATLELTDLYRCLGAAYVIEGSTLGGRFILSRLPHALAPLRGRATSFLDGYGAATGPRWKAFGVIVEQAVTSPAHETAMVAGARATFTAMIDWLFHLKYVAQALTEDDPGVMAAYARWLQTLLCARGMCSRHLAENFGRLGRAIADLDGDTASAVAMVTAAAEALRYSDGPARAAQDRGPALVAELGGMLATEFPAAAHRAALDVAFLVDYAADAIALGGPKTFDTHAEWLPGFLAEQGAPAGYADALIAAVRGTLLT